MCTFSGDLILPRPLQCGGFQKVLSVGVIWFSSGGTKSVLHSDDVDNINCILDGEKRIVFIDWVKRLFCSCILFRRKEREKLERD